LRRTAIGLIGLGLIGGVVPTGLQGITYALPVLAGTAGALTALVICCLASAVATRRQAIPVTLRWGLPFGPGRVVTRATSPSGAHVELGVRSPAKYREEPSPAT
jgi:hypothetical protein